MLPGRQSSCAWADRVVAQLHEVLGEIGRYDYEIHAGAAYIDCGLRSALLSAGAGVTVVPAGGLRMGEQLAFYRDHRPR
jgi:hypothetical protein